MTADGPGNNPDAPMSALQRSVRSRVLFMAVALLALHWLCVQGNSTVADLVSYIDAISSTAVYGLSSIFMLLQDASPAVLALRIGSPALAALLLHLLYRRLLSSSRRLRQRWSVPDDGPLHRICPALHLLSIAYLLLYWAVRHCPDSVREALNSAAPVAAESLFGRPFWVFMHTAAAGVDWLVLLPQTVLSLSAAVMALAVGALVELKYRPSLRALPSGHRGCLQLACLLHAYFALVAVVALYSGPFYALQVFAVAFLGAVFLVTFRQVLRATHTSPFHRPFPPACPVTATTSNKLRQILLFLLFALFYPLSGRLLFFLTGHRMDFGTLQVLVVCMHLYLYM